MPPIDSHQSAKTTKMLLLGANGSGKTGALASLAAAGYNVRILDLDNGCDALKDYLTNPASPYKHLEDAVKRVSFATVTDPMRKLPTGRMVPKQAKVWTRAMDILTNWGPTPDTSPPSWSDEAIQGDTFGPLSDWGPQDVLAIDSLTMLGNAALNLIMYMNNRLGAAIQQGDWWGAQQYLESLFQTIFDEGIQCNVIINCHIKYIGEEGGPQVGYPDCPGKALSPKMGTYFNTILLAKSTGIGRLARRKIITKSQDGIELKTGAPITLAAEYPLETGLAEIFAAIRGQPKPDIIKPGALQ